MQNIYSNHMCNPNDWTKNGSWHLQYRKKSNWNIYYQFKNTIGNSYKLHKTIEKSHHKMGSSKVIKLSEQPI